MDQFRGKKEKSYENRHEKFQFPNPMKMTDFEEELALKEKIDRAKAHHAQTAGILGEDGGEFPGRFPS